MSMGLKEHLGAAVLSTQAGWLTAATLFSTPHLQRQDLVKGEVWSVLYCTLPYGKPAAGCHLTGL